MRIYRCFHPGTHTAGATVELDENEIQHLAAARRIYPGDKVFVLNGGGVEYAATVAEARKKLLTLTIDGIAREQPPPTAEAGLAAALTKGADFDDMFQRAVELGLTLFQPLFTERVAVELDPWKMEKRRERWRRLAVEALKQCERLWLPKINVPITLEEFAVPRAETETQIIVLHERESGIPMLREIMRQNTGRGFTVLVGPEGGWSPAESELFARSNFPLASLTGEAILRAETAALAALSIALAQRG